MPLPTRPRLRNIDGAPFFARDARGVGALYVRTTQAPRGGEASSLYRHPLSADVRPDRLARRIARAGAIDATCWELVDVAPAAIAAPRELPRAAFPW